MFVCDPARAEGYAGLARKAGVPHLLTLGADGGGTLTDGAREAAAEFRDAPMSADELAVIIYTSGTTGRSKGRWSPTAT